MNLLITGAWPDAKKHIPELEAMGHSVAFLQQERDELPCDPDWVEGGVCNGLFLYHSIECFPNLRFVQLTSAGYYRVDMDYVRAHHIEIHNAKGVYSIPMAEFAVAGVLQLYKQSRFFYENQKSHRWEKHRGLLELHGKTVTVVGCGSVGTECAKRFRAFGCHVIGVNRTAREDAAFETILPPDRLDEILPKTDVLVLSVALTNETMHLMDRRRLGLLPHNAVVVNVSRGKVLDETALRDLLEADKLYGAVLDVFENEPLPESDPLWDAPNVIVTPHNSFVGEGNGERLSAVVVSAVSCDFEAGTRQDDDQTVI
jgi:phosphoglycerate dehydrogenase-like enzyme